MRKLAAVLVTIAVVLAGAASAVGALSGNPSGDSLARSVLGAYNKLHGFAYTESGYFWISSGLGRFSYFSYEYATAKGPAGFSRAKETATVGLKNGKVVWWRDQLTPVGNSQFPVEVVMNHSGEFYAFVSGNHHTCFGKLHGPLPSTFGGPGYVISGKVSAPQPSGNSLLLTYVYPWTKKSTASETDTVSKSTDLVSVARVHVHSGGNVSAFTFTTKFTYPSKLSAPKVNRCK